MRPTVVMFYRSALLERNFSTMARTYSYSVVTLVALLLGCNGAVDVQSDKFKNDTTAPGFVSVVVRLEQPPATSGPEFDIKSADVQKKDLTSVRIRLLATAADYESGVTSLTAVSELSWHCSSGRNNPTTGTIQTIPVPFVSASSTTPAPDQKSLSIDFLADPVGATNCSTAHPGWGAVGIGGYVRVTATNGKGLTATSKTFAFDYRDIGSR